MHADIQGALEHVNKYYKCFRHNNKQLSKVQVVKVLQFGLKKGYKTTAEFTDEEVEAILFKPEPEQKNIQTTIV